MEDIRVALITLNSVCGKTEENLEKHIEWIKKAASDNVDVICFPELSLTGYSSKEIFTENAVTVPSEITDRLSEISKDKKITVLAGLAEKDSSGKRYASHLIFNSDGEITIYRKIHLAPPEKKLYEQGNDLSLFNIKDIKCGVQLCYDIHFPELTTAMTKGSAEIIFVPHASPRGTPDTKYQSWMRHLRARAFDNSIFIVACNQSGENGMGLSFSGVSVAIDPSGEVIDQRLDNSEGMLVVDLTKEIFEHVRGHEMRYFFPNRRPEIYNL
ncbi:MAG: nitrilase [Desulfobacterales bacterium]|nr:nitrilase [Desulfobacterales bacterium]